MAGCENCKYDKGVIIFRDSVLETVQREIYKKAVELELSDPFNVADSIEEIYSVRDDFVDLPDFCSFPVEFLLQKKDCVSVIQENWVNYKERFFEAEAPMCELEKLISEVAVKILKKVGEEIRDCL